MNSEAALTETWIVWIFNPGATIIRSSSCYESDSRYTKHYPQFWRYHNHISGLMPLTNSYLTTILVHMLWHSGELHILAPLALLYCDCFTMLFISSFWCLWFIYPIFSRFIQWHMGNIWSDPEGYGSKQLLTNFPFVQHICINEFSHHWLR